MPHTNTVMKKPGPLQAATYIQGGVPSLDDIGFVTNCVALASVGFGIAVTAGIPRQYILNETQFVTGIIFAALTVLLTWWCSRRMAVMDRRDRTRWVVNPGIGAAGWGVVGGSVVLLRGHPGEPANWEFFVTACVGIAVACWWTDQIRVPDVDAGLGEGVAVMREGVREEMKHWRNNRAYVEAQQARKSSSGDNAAHGGAGLS